MRASVQPSLSSISAPNVGSAHSGLEWECPTALSSFSDTGGAIVSTGLPGCQKLLAPTGFDLREVGRGERRREEESMRIHCLELGLPDGGHQPFLVF